MLQAVRLLTELARPNDHRRDSEETMVEPGQSTSNDTSIQFREIYKNGWLRRTDKTDKETSRFWVSFCVHDDIEPKLEGFIDQKHATTHSPLWSNSLRGIQHVTPTLCATSRHDYEYCINFNDDRVLRLAAPTYQGMLDWVQLITRKLTDMKILRPKENLYSRGPERIATRDPTSPLPPPPSIISSSENISLQNSTIDTSPPPPTPVPAPINTPNSTNSPARVDSPQTTPMIFTFEDISIEERRTRPVQSQTQRTSPPTPSPRSIPTTSTDESSYESIFMASSYTPSSTDEPIRNVPRETTTTTLSSSPPSQSQPPASSSSSSSTSSSSSSSSLSLSLVPSQSNEPSNERYAVLMEYRSSATSESTPRSSINHTETSESINRPSVSNLSRILTLREQQICQLKREMNHRAGVRLKLGRRDCKDSIAFVDTFGSIWVAGWKQREHPQLYNVLHVGDMVLSVAGQVPLNANGIKDILKGITTPRIEVIVRRLPYARAMTLRKRTDNEDFGLEVNGNEISGVTGVALSAGLPQLADATNPSAPTGSNTTWTLTEVNGKPLSIFDGGASDRLRAVGRDISIVIQPTDLVWSFRKKLRTMRSYKNFILQ